MSRENVFRDSFSNLVDEAPGEGGGAVSDSAAIVPENPLRLGEAKRTTPPPSPGAVGWENVEANEMKERASRSTLDSRSRS